VCGGAISEDAVTQPIIMGGVAPNAGRRWRPRVPAGTRAAALEVTASHQLAELDCVGNTWVNRAVLDKASAVIGARRRGQLCTFGNPHGVHL